jgi:DNA-binding CsgD family transcriptional regulator/tetratricopeptide (TPR) repeat protein
MTVAVIVGRSTELADLTGAVTDAATGGTGTAVAIEGDPGIGKSTLLREAANVARAQGLLVLQTTGVETETELPFSGLHQLLSPLIAHTSSLPTPQWTALMSAFGVEVTGPPQPFLVALAALNVLSGVAERQPLLVAVDDIQWLDRQTNDALTFIARRVTSEPLVMLAAIRTGYDEAYLTACQRRIPLGALEDGASRQLLDIHGDGLTPAERRQVLDHAQGNPLALTELPAVMHGAGSVREAMADGSVPLSERLERAFAARLVEQAPSTVDTLLIAATDSECDLGEILAGASVMAQSPISTEALAPAVTAALVHLEPTGLTFRHPLVRSAVLQREPLHRRQQAHAALADVLVDDAYRRTWHRAQSIVGRDDAVADALYDNHTVSLQRGSVTTAIAALERSAELTTDSATRGRRLLLAAEHAFGLGRADIVDRLLAAASRTELSDLDRTRQEWLREIFNDGIPGDPARVLELCQNARKAASANDFDLALNLLLGASLRCWWADAGQEACRQVVTVANELPNACRDSRYIATLATAAPIRQVQTVDRLLSQFVVETLSDPDELRLLGQAAHAIGDPARGVEFLDRAETKMREQGRVGLLGQVLTMGAYDHLALGDLQRAVTALTEAQRIAEETGQPIWNAGSLSVNAVAFGLRGDVDRALAMSAEAEQRAYGRRLTNLLAVVQLARGCAFVGIGHHTEGYLALSRLFDSADPAFHEAERFHGIMDYAEAAARTGHLDEAFAVIADLEGLAETCSSPLLHNQLLHARAVLADDDHAEQLYTSALSADLIRWPWVKARLELAFGSWLRRRRRVAESRHALRSALTTFDVIGASTWAAQARTELRAAGERIAYDPKAVHNLLSPQELQIARLVAEGLSNKEIGERLYLSPRTISSHLYRIFPKLDISSRAQMAARLRNT